MTLTGPKRPTSWPVTKLGANMPKTCHWMTKALSAKSWPQASMASGVAVISRFIVR